MKDIEAWAARTGQRERGVVRLEDALLAGRFARYFLHRLRFFIARAAVSTVLHAIKILLLAGAFPRAQFLIIVILQSGSGLTGDFWWGALERLRGQVRALQTRSARHLIPREIARWLTLSSRLTIVGLSVAGLYAAEQLLSGSFGAVDLYLVALVVGISLDLTTRAYHSGAYALRRVYRPLPSLLALDVSSIVVLLALWPFIGIWAFPAAELVSALVVAAVTLYFTTRTYRTLALPTLLPLLRERRPIPGLRVLREALPPGVAFALVGLEALVVIAGVGGASTASGATLVVLLAALSPVSRASFEWARLMYFDLKRLHVPLLAGLRRGFDRAIAKLAVVIGVFTWAIAATVAVVVMPAATPLLIVALLALFEVRSLLAGAQMQAFTRTNYARLTIAGAVGVAAVLAVFAATTVAETRLIGVAAALAVSLLLLLSLPHGTDPSDAVLSLPEWLHRMRLSPDPVVVSRMSFDDRYGARGTPVEARRTEQWRRDAVAQRLGLGLLVRGGGVAWVGPLQLWCLEPASKRITERALVASAAGLLHRQTAIVESPDARAAALEMSTAALALWPEDAPASDHDAVAEAPTLPSVDDLLADFGLRFPTGFAYDVSRRPPRGLLDMPSDLRREVYRSALDFAHDLRRGRGPEGFEATALAEDGVLRAVFVVDRSAPHGARRAWRHIVRAWSVRSAAGVPVSEGVAAVGLKVAASEGASATGQNAAML